MRAAQDVEGEVIHTWTQAASLPKGPQQPDAPPAASARSSLSERSGKTTDSSKTLAASGQVRIAKPISFYRVFFTEKVVSVNVHWLFFATTVSAGI